MPLHNRPSWIPFTFDPVEAVQFMICTHNRHVASVFQRKGAILVCPTLYKLVFRRTPDLDFCNRQ